MSPKTPKTEKTTCSKPRPPLPAIAIASILTNEYGAGTRRKERTALPPLPPKGGKGEGREGRCRTVHRKPGPPIGREEKKGEKYPKDFFTLRLKCRNGRRMSIHIKAGMVSAETNGETAMIEALAKEIGSKAEFIRMFFVPDSGHTSFYDTRLPAVNWSVRLTKSGKIKKNSLRRDFA